MSWIGFSKWNWIAKRRGELYSRNMSQTSAATAIELSTLSRVLLKVPVPWVFVLGYFVGVGLQHAILPRPYLSARITHGLSVFGMVMFGVGCVIAGWGLVLFHMARTTTTPGEASKALVMRGPYRFTRNPMYVGLTLAYLGEMATLVEIAPLIPLLFVIAYVNWIVIPVEETKLRAVFGEGYAQYCDHVGRWI
jgi:protein-S-isoprenylcysteine O-methyltransferase Ste14